jgi:hypothetical protein
MENIKKILAVIFAILFIATAVFALVLFTFDRRAFKAETYQRVLANEDFYNRIPAVLAESIISSPANFQELPPVMQGMNTKAWEEFFRTLLPQEALKLIGDDTLNQTFAYLNMQSNTVAISLLPIKANMATESGVQAVFTLFRTQPDCTLLQVAQMTFNLLSAQDNIAFCNPPEELTPLLTPVIQAELQAAALVIPDEVTILTSENAQNDPRQRIQTARTWMKLSPLLPIGFLFLLTLTVINSLQSWLSWWGIPFLSTGAIAMLISLTGAPVIGAILKRIVAQRISVTLPAALSDYTSELASAMVGTILRPIFWEGLILFLVGLGMVLTAIYIKRRTTSKIRNASEEKTLI